MQLGLIGVVARVAREQPLHGGDLGIAEAVVLEIGETPPGLGKARIYLQRGFIGGLAVGAPAERLLHVSHGDAQPHFFGLETRGVLVGFERVFLSHHPRGDAGGRDPGLRALRLDLPQVAGGGVRLLEATQGDERRCQSPVGQRQVLALLQSMAQQPLGIVGPVGGE